METEEAPKNKLLRDELQSEHPKELLSRQKSVADTTVTTIKKDQPPTPQHELVSKDGTAKAITLHNNINALAISSNSGPTLTPMDTPPSLFLLPPSSAPPHVPRSPTFQHIACPSQGIASINLMAEIFLFMDWSLR